MPQAPDIVLGVSIAVGRERLHAFLCDLDNYVALHPLIERIEEIEPSPELPRARRYRVLDRIPIGPFRLRTSYVAALDPVSDDEVHGHAWQSPGVRLHTVYRLSESVGATRLDERVFVRAPWWIHRFVVKQARAAHAATLERMKGLLEANPPGSGQGDGEQREPREQRQTEEGTLPRCAP